MDIASLGIKVDSTSVTPAVNGLDKLTASGVKAEQSTTKLTNASAALSNTLRTVAAAVGLYKLGDLARDSAMMAARYETLGVVMKTVGNNAGYTGAQMEQFAQGLQKSGIAMVESRTVLTRMAQAHIDLSKSSEIARVAQDAAVIGNINSSEAFERMIHGIQSGQTEILRTIGINVNFEKSYQSLAVQLGKNAKDLTETEKMQARVNVVMEAGAGIAGTYEAAMGTAGKQILSMQRYWDNLKVTAGGAFLAGLAEGTKELTGALKDSEQALREEKSQMDALSSTIKGGVSDAIKDMRFAIGGIKDIWDSLPAAAKVGAGLVGMILFGVTSPVAATVTGVALVVDQVRKMKDIINEIKAGNLSPDEVDFKRYFTDKDAILAQAAFNAKRNRASAASDAILNGPTQIGAVIAGGRLKSDMAGTIEGMAAARSAGDAAQAASKESARLADQWKSTRRNLEQEINLSGLNGLDKKLQEITDKATEYHLQFDKAGGKASIDAWEESTKAVARQAEEMERITKELKYQAQANEDQLALEKELELAVMSKDQREIQGIKESYDLLRNKSHLLTIIGKQTEEDEARISAGLTVNEEMEKYKILAAAEGVRFAQDAAWLGEQEAEAGQFVKIWDNAVENIQKSMADFLFDPFKDGLDGMLKGFGTMLQRMVAEAVAADLAKRIFGGTSGEIGGWAGTALEWVGGMVGGSGGGTPASMSQVEFFDSLLGATDFSMAGGGVISEPVVGMGLSTGKSYAFGENGPEAVLNQKQLQGGKSEQNISITVNVASGTPDEVRRSAAAGARSALSAFSAAQRFA